MSAIGQRERLIQQQVLCFFQEKAGYLYQGGWKACDGDGCDTSKEGGTW